MTEVGGRSWYGCVNTGVPADSRTLNNEVAVTKRKVMETLDSHVCNLRIKVLGKSEALVYDQYGVHVAIEIY